MRTIKFTDGCPNGCEYCYEPKVKPTYYNPQIPHTDLSILDMNFLANPDFVNILVSLPKGKHEFICGLDYRRLTQQICDLIHKKGFQRIRWAWDYGFHLQKVHNNIWKMWRKAGYRNEELMVFMICDWKIPYEECCKKLDLLKVWNVKVSDCWFDGVVSPNFQCNFWTLEQCKDFRKKCRKHNQMVLFKIDPEYKQQQPERK